MSRQSTGNEALDGFLYDYKEVHPGQISKVNKLEGGGDTGRVSKVAYVLNSIIKSRAEWKQSLPPASPSI